MFHPQIQRLSNNEDITGGWHLIRQEGTSHIGIKKNQTALFRSLDGFSGNHKSPHSHWRFVRIPVDERGQKPTAYCFPSFRFIEGGYECAEVMWFWTSEKEVGWTKLK